MAAPPSILPSMSPDERASNDRSSNKHDPNVSNSCPGWDCLVIGYGNELRGDDAVGPQTAMAVGQWHRPGVGAIAVHQLAPELAPMLAKAQTVIFVDAIVDRDCEALQIKTISPADQHQLFTPTPSFSHHYDPVALLLLSQMLYGRAPEGWLFQIPARQFAFGQGLSPTAQRGSQQALQAICQHLQPHRLHPPQLDIDPSPSPRLSMHELSLMQSILEQALNHAQQQKAQQLHRIKLKLGEASGVVPEALEFAFEVVAAGTLAAEATLEIERVPLLCWCSVCQQTFHPPSPIYQCPDCQALSQQIHQGNELELTSLELS